MRDTTVPMKPTVRAYAKVTRANGDVEIVAIDDIEVVVLPNDSKEN